MIISKEQHSEEKAYRIWEH